MKTFLMALFLILGLTLLAVDDFPSKEQVFKGFKFKGDDKIAIGEICDFCTAVRAESKESSFVMITIDPVKFVESGARDKGREKLALFLKNIIPTWRNAELAFMKYLGEAASLMKDKKVLFFPYNDYYIRCSVSEEKYYISFLKPQEPGEGK